MSLPNDTCGSVVLVARSLGKTFLAGVIGGDMSGVIKLAEMLPQTKLQSLR